MGKIKSLTEFISRGTAARVSFAKMMQQHDHDDDDREGNNVVNR